MMKVRKIREAVDEAAAVPALLDREGIAFHPLACVGWAEYPYCPKAEVRCAHTDNAFLLHYRVNEKSVRAKYAADNGRVWTDSCVEFFVIPGGDDIYYNIECNCIGAVLLAAGTEREGREQAPAETVFRISRWTTLGRAPFEERLGETAWEVALLVPYEVFFRHRIASLDGKVVRGNFYKCGDELQTPHFVSFAPVRTEKPDFHRPDFFVPMAVE